jgi:hypothetical protein
LEVRFGADGVRLWRLARAEDPRRPFGASPRTLPRASCAWTDYALRDAERLLFVLHRLVGHVCEALWVRGEGARALTLRFALANRSSVEHPLQAAHPTADRAAWMRLVRAGVERLRLPDAVTGVAVRVTAALPMHDRQGDIFDRGFATARATEHAVAQLLDTCGPEVMTLAATDHPLLERRARWQIRESVVLDGVAAAAGPPASAAAVRPSLALQLLPEPRPVAVVTTPRRDHDVPVRYHEPGPRRTTSTTSGGGREVQPGAARGAVRGTARGTARGAAGGAAVRGVARGGARRAGGGVAHRSTNGTVVEVLVAAGPDRVDGGSWEGAPHAREYFHCITADGRLVLLFREADAWYLHGWWD